MKAYPEYKDSNSEIIKAIPTHWDIAPLKFIGNIILGKMLTPQDKGGYIEKPYLRAKNIGWETVDDEDINTMWFSQYELEQYRLKQDDLLISEGGEVGRTAIWNNELEECYIQNSVHKVTINQRYNPRYYLYHSQVFGKTGYYDSIVNRVSIGHLTGEKLKDIRFVVPPLPEQQAIADFLDRKTAQIDTLIEKKQRQIDLLQEQRTALINHAITKGLNPDVRMKDSDVEWLGEIPSHWRTAKAKQVSKIFVPQRNKPELNQDGDGLPWITTEDLTSVNVGKSHRNYYVSMAAAKESGSKPLPAGSVIASCIGRFGVSSVSKCELIINQQLQAYIPHSINPWFLHYYIIISKHYFERVATSSTLPYVNQENFGMLPVTLPPLEEQDEIVQHIENSNSLADKIIGDYQKQIEYFQEYRTALISEAVTGKVDVRGENAVHE